jgi:hypothetical protein
MKRHKGSINIVKSQLSESDIRNCCISIIDGSGKRFFMQADGDKEKNEWFAVLEHVIAINQ